MSRGIRLITKSKRRLTLVTTVIVALGAVVGAIAYFVSVGTGTGSASAGKLNPPTAVAASTTAGSGSVSVSWTASSTADGVAPQGYVVTRVRNSDSSTAAACGSSPLSLVGGTSCSDLSVADGTYHYIVTSVYRGWTATSTASNDVTVVNDNTAPTVSAVALTNVATGASSVLKQGGQYYVYANAADNAGGSGLASVKADVSSLTLGASAISLSTTGGPFTVGSSSYEFRSAVQTADSPLPEGTKSITVTATDNLALTGNKTISVSVDNTAPVSTASLSPGANAAGWNNSQPVQVTLSSSDVSGVDSTVYAKSGAESLATTTYTGPFDVTTSGTTTVTFHATDRAGNVEGGKTQLVKIDLVAPSTSIGFSPASPNGSNGWYTTAPTFILSGSDAGSGVKATFYKIDAGTTQTYSGAVTVPEGQHTVTYWSTDNADNAETPSTSATIKVDSVKPATAIALSPASPDGSGGWYTSTPTFTLSASDATSGVAATRFQIDSGAVQTYPGSAVSIPDGQHTISYWSVDTAGNTEPTNTTATIKVDTVKPSTTDNTATIGNAWRNTNATVTLTPSDPSPASGVAATYYTTDGSTPTTSSSQGTSISLTTTGVYTIKYFSVDTAGNQEAVKTASTQIRIDKVAPANALSLTGTPTGAFLSGATLYFRNSAAGSFTLTNAVTDANSGPASSTFPLISTAGWTHAAATVSTPAGGPYSSNYAWTSGAGTPGATNITATDVASNTNTGTSLTFVNDTTAPAGGALTVNGLAATAGGSSSTATAAFAIARTDYTEAQTATASGVASSTLTIQSATLTGTTCGAAGSGGPFTSATTITGTTQPSGIVAGFCYVYTLTGTDNVGNAASVKTTVTATDSFVITNPGAQTAGSAFNVTLTASYNGVTDTGYTGSKTIVFSGPGSSADNTAPSYPASVTFTNGVGTANMTLFKAETPTLTATQATITGATSFAVNPATATKVSWTSVSVSAGTLSANCANTCTGTALGNNQTFTSTVSVSDSWGNVVSNLGASATATVSITQNQSGGQFTAPGTAGTTNRTLTIPASGAATSSVTFTYKAANNGTWTDKLSAAVPSYTTATLTLTKQ